VEANPWTGNVPLLFDPALTAGDLLIVELRSLPKGLEQESVFVIFGSQTPSSTGPKPVSAPARKNVRGPGLWFVPLSPEAGKRGDGLDTSSGSINQVPPIRRLEGVAGHRDAL
jgi:hypothetical protein